MKFDEQGFRHLVDETISTIIRLGTTSHAVLAGHENSKITMDIYAKAKYNRPKDVAPMLEHVFDQWNETTTK